MKEEESKQTGNRNEAKNAAINAVARASNNKPTVQQKGQCTK